MKKQSSKDAEQITRTCYNCGKTIKQNEIWYPTMDISACGGGVLYLHARCMIEQIFGQTKADLLERIANAELETDDLLSDGVRNFYASFPISPIHWVKYALDDDEKEIEKIVEENKKQNKNKSIRKTKTK